MSDTIMYGNMFCRMYTADNAESLFPMLYNDGVKTWLNLTNGIECVPYLKEKNIPYDFCRFRSCSFEQKRWGDAIDSMPDDMLMRLALGIPQAIVDFGANRPCSRAIRQGIPIALRICAEAWLPYEFDDRPMYIFNRNGNVRNVGIDFAKQVASLNKRQKSRLKYFSKYFNSDCMMHGLYLYSAPTVHDGDYNYYSKIVEKYK